MNYFDEELTPEQWINLDNIVNGKQSAAISAEDVFSKYKTQEEIDAQPGVLKRGLMGGGVYGGASLLTGAAGLAADAVGADETAEKLYTKSMDIAKTGQEKYPQYADMDKVFDDPTLSNITEWIGYNAAATIPMMAGSMGVGSLTSIGAKTFGKQLLKEIGENAVKKATTQELAELGSDAIAKAAVSKAVERIGVTGAAGAMSAPEAGGMWLNDVQKHGVEGSSPFIDALMGGVSGSLEMLPFGVESSFIKAAFGEAGESTFREAVRKGEKEVAESMMGKALQRLGSGAGEAGRQFLGEGVQESAQELTSMANEAMLAQPGETPDLYNVKGAKRLLESGIIGGVVGAPSGAVMGMARHNADGPQISGESIQSADTVTDIIPDTEEPEKEAAQPERKLRTADELIDILEPQKSQYQDLSKGVNRWMPQYSPRDFNADPSFPSDTNIDVKAAQSFRAFEQGQSVESRDSVLSQRKTEQQKLTDVLSGLAQAKQSAEIQAQEQVIMQSPMGARLLRNRLEQEQANQIYMQQPQAEPIVQQQNTSGGNWIESLPGNEPIELPRYDFDAENFNPAIHQAIGFMPEAQAELEAKNKRVAEYVEDAAARKVNEHTEPPQKVNPDGDKKVLPVNTKIEWSDKSGNTLAGTIIGVKGNRYEIERANPKPGQGRKTFLHTGYDVREVGNNSSTENETAFTDRKTDDYEEAQPDYSGYEDRLKDRMARISQARTPYDVSAIKDEETSDKGRHFDGTSRIVAAASNKIKQINYDIAEAEQRKQDFKDLDDGKEVVWLNLETSGGAQEVVSRVQDELGDQYSVRYRDNSPSHMFAATIYVKKKDVHYSFGREAAVRYVKKIEGLSGERKNDSDISIQVGSKTQFVSLPEVARVVIEAEENEAIPPSPKPGHLMNYLHLTGADADKVLEYINNNAQRHRTTTTTEPASNYNSVAKKEPWEVDPAEFDYIKKAKAKANGDAYNDMANEARRLMGGSFGRRAATIARKVIGEKGDYSSLVSSSGGKNIVIKPIRGNNANTKRLEKLSQDAADKSGRIAAMYEVSDADGVVLGYASTVLPTSKYNPAAATFFDSSKVELSEDEYSDPDGGRILKSEINESVGDVKFPISVSAVMHFEPKKSATETSFDKAYSKYRHEDSVTHEDHVRDAMEKGKPVPSSVLAWYKNKPWAKKYFEKKASNYDRTGVLESRRQADEKARESKEQRKADNEVAMVKWFMGLKTGDTFNSGGNNDVVVKRKNKLSVTSEGGATYTLKELIGIKHDEALKIMNKVEKQSPSTPVENKAQNTSADRIEETARKLMADADIREKADRQTNTHKRATQAGYAIERALADKSLAETMIRIAGAIRSGETKHLGGIKSKADVETLELITRSAIRTTENKKERYGDRDIHRDFMESRDSGSIRYPYPVVHREALKDLARAITPVKGGKGLAARLDGLVRRTVTNDLAYIVGSGDIGLLREAVKLLPGDRNSLYIKKRIQDNLVHYDRIKRMGINGDVIKEAIAEYSELRSGKKKEDPIKALEREIYTQKNIGVDFFPTSKEVAADLAERLDVKPGMSVLEPSAGSGRLIDAVKETEPNAKIEAVEMSSKLRELLNARGDNVVEHDFMDLGKDKLYDRILMNPPFSNSLDIEHVMKAYEHLKPGGKLIAIMGEGAFFRSDKKASGFREWLDEVNGTSEKLPEGSFNHNDMVQRTGVNSRVVEIDKPGETTPVKAKKASDLYGISGTSYLNDNTPIDFKYKIAEASEPISSHDSNFNENPAYPQDIQPRERGKRDALKLQVEGMANNIIPEKIGESANLSSGAPVVGKDGVVESGNGRIMAIRKAYDSGKADGYKKWLIDNADRFGLDKKDIESMKQPVLLRERETEVEDRSLFAKQANKDEVAKMSASEDAAADAGIITNDDLVYFAPSEDGDIGAASNRTFVRRFLEKLHTSESSGYLTEDGRATKQLADRIRNAIFHKAYGDKDLTAMASEEANPDLRTVLNGLLVAAPDIVKAMSVESEMGGEKLNSVITDAVNVLKRARDEYEDVPAPEGRTKLAAQLNSYMAQGRMFGKKPTDLSEPVKLISRFIAESARSGKKIGLFLKTIAKAARAYHADQVQQKSLFGESEPFNLEHEINKAKEIIDGRSQDKQQSLFNRESGSDNRQDSGSGEPDRRRRPATENAEGDRKGQKEAQPEGNKRRSGTGIKYSLSESKGHGLPKSKISEALKPASSRMAFEVVQNESELPPHVSADISEKGYSGRAEALFDPETGKVFFVADNIGSEKAAQTGFLDNLFRHEGRHAAISQMFESKGARNMFMDRSSRLFKADVAEYMKKNGLEDTKENTRTAAEEALVNQAVKGGVHALLDEFMGKIVRWARKIFPNLSMTRAEARAFIRRADSMIESGFSGKSDGKAVLGSEKSPVKYSLKDRTTSLSELGITTEYSDVKSKDKDGNEITTRQLVITGPFKDQYKKLMPMIGGEYKYQKVPGSRRLHTRNVYIFKNPSETIESDIASLIKAYHAMKDFGLDARFREKENGDKILFVDGPNLHMLSDTMKKLGAKFIKPQDDRKPYLLFKDPEVSTPGKIAQAAKSFDDTLARMRKVSRDKSQDTLSAMVKPKDESAKATGKRIIEDLKSIFAKSDIVLPSNNTDITKGYHWIQTETDMAKNNDKFRKVYEVQQQYEAIATQKTAEDREMTKPYYDLDKEQRKPVNRALLFEDDNRTELKTSELKNKFGLDEKQIAGHQAIRGLYKKKLREVVRDMLKAAFSDLYFDDAFVNQILDAGSRNEMFTLLKDHGVSEKSVKDLSWIHDWITERKGYIPHKWDSEWLVRVNTPDGETWLLDVPTITGSILPTQALREGAANKAAVRVIKERIGWSDGQIKEWIESGNITLIKSKELPVDMFHGASMHVMESIIESATDRAWEEQKDSFTSEQLMKQTDLKAAIRKEMEELFLAKGAGKHFITRKGVKGFRTDLENITAEYVGGMNHWLVKRDKAAAFSRAMKDIDPRQTPELFKHARAFVDDMLGESQEASWFKRFAGIWFLGADVSAAALNGFQNFTHAAPKMMEIKGKDSVYSELGKAMKDCFNEWKEARKDGRNLFTGESKHLQPDEIQAIRDLYMQGFFDPAVVGEQTGFHPSDIWNNYADQTTKVLMGMFTGVESLNRSSSFLAAYRRAKKAGVADPIQAGKDVVIAAHFAGGKANRPLIVRRMGAAGNIAYTFMMFPVNNLFFLKDIFKNALTALYGKDKEKIATSLKVVGAHLGALFTIGGLSALPFASVLAPLAKGVFSDDDDDWEIALRKHMPPELGRLLVRGLPAVMGNDMSGRISSDVIGMPAGFGVIQTMAKRANRAGDYFVQGEPLDAVMMLTPDFIRNPYNAVMGIAEGGEKRGRSPVKYSAWQAANKALGFSPTSETEAYAAKQSLDNIKTKRSEKLADFAEQLLQLQKKNDSISISKLRKSVSGYNELQKKDNDPVIKWSDVIKSANQRRKMRNKGYLDRISGKMKAQKQETFEAMGV